MYKKSLYAAVAVASVLVAHNAIASATPPIEPNAISSTDLVTSTELETSNTIDVVTKFMEVSPIESTMPPIGESESNAVEASGISDLPGVNTILRESNWKYVAQILESEADALSAGTYKAELFENDRSKGVLFLKQAVVDDETIEGVVAVWDIGNDLPLNAVYTVKVTKSSLNAQGGESI